MATHMQVKVGVVLAKIIQQDFVLSWHSAFSDLEQVATPILYLRTLDALFEANYSEIDPTTRQLKDVLRGISSGIQHHQYPSNKPYPLKYWSSC
jgi:hypothetical protein